MGQSCRELMARQKAVLSWMSSEPPRHFRVMRLMRAPVRCEELQSGSGKLAGEQARFSANEFHFFLGPARRSLVEVETQLMIAQNLAYFTPEHRKQVLDKAAELGKILNGLISAIMPAA